jgi:hypothetical protein
VIDCRDVTAESDQIARRQARGRVEEKRNEQRAVIAYALFNALLVVNVFLVGIWAATGSGYFWPGWVLAGWGAVMLLGFWRYWRRPITEADVDDELRRTP